MNEWKVKNVETGDVWHKDSRKECEEAIQEFPNMDLEVIAPNGEERANITDDGAVVQQGGKQPDGGDNIVQDTQVTEPEVVEDSLPDDPSIDQNPTEWLPSHFIDEIQGVPTVNRKGYAVIASKYDVSVKAEPVTLPSETEFEYAEFRAIAVTDSGQEYSGFGSAHINRQDGDDPHLLAELAETRAMKRAVSWATGVGMTAAEELMHEL